MSSRHKNRHSDSNSPFNSPRESECSMLGECGQYRRISMSTAVNGARSFQDVATRPSLSLGMVGGIISPSGKHFTILVSLAGTPNFKVDARLSNAKSSNRKLTSKSSQRTSWKTWYGGVALIEILVPFQATCAVGPATNIWPWPNASKVSSNSRNNLSRTLDANEFWLLPEFLPTNSSNSHHSCPRLRRRCLRLSTKKRVGRKRIHAMR